MNMGNSFYFSPQSLTPVIQELKQNGGRLLLVQKQGVFIIAENGAVDPKGQYLHLAYAIGFDPNEHEDWRQKAYPMFQGHDVEEELAKSDYLFELIVDDGFHLKLTITQDNIAHSAVYEPKL